jgi:uncharacterized protein YuzE
MLILKYISKAVVELGLSDLQPDGIIEIVERVNIDTTADGKLAGIEILKASKKIYINNILSYSLELDRGILGKLENELIIEQFYSL